MVEMIFSCPLQYCSNDNSPESDFPCPNAEKEVPLFDNGNYHCFIDEGHDDPATIEGHRLCRHCASSKVECPKCGSGPRDGGFPQPLKK